MKKQIIISLKMLGIMTFLLGIIYPLFITAIAQFAFPEKANGSLVDVEGTLQGSQLIGQEIANPIYFHARPSAIHYNTLTSGGSNLSLTSKKLYEDVEARKYNFKEKNSLEKGVCIPSEMLFDSGSGLDPHISSDAAKIQVKRILDARGFSKGKAIQLNNLVDKLTEGPQFGILGNKRVNVFMLNLELDKLK